MLNHVAGRRLNLAVRRDLGLFTYERRVSNIEDLVKQRVGLRFSGACVLFRKVRMLGEPQTDSRCSRHLIIAAYRP